MKFISVVVDNKKNDIYHLKLQSDLETTTATYDMAQNKLEIDGFNETLKYVMTKDFILNLISKFLIKNPDAKKFAYGRG
ncbi:hypothetical protein [Lactobacillus hominis]|uniref:hypothetical protein n=1 Tax=Lactobacillus hominis TaxID=1203033 RepID=UPI0023F463AC|nr:hypothetical protein [Lactobacillus hominis]